jgi:uncharacterized membrane protein YfcA
MSSLLLLLCGFLSGSINTLSGGGSLLSLPALMLFDLSPAQANASNRVAVLLQSATGAHQMHKAFPFPLPLTLLLSLPAALGSTLGSILALHLSSPTLRSVLAFSLLFALALMFLKPERFLTKPSTPPEPPLLSSPQPPQPHSQTNTKITKPSPKQTLLLSLLLFSIGIYAGLLQAGVGVLFALALVLCAHWDLMAASSAKNLIVFTCTLPALLTFFLSDLIIWPPALILAAGSIFGAWITAKYLPKIKHVRPLTLVFTAATVAVASVKLLFF